MLRPRADFYTASLPTAADILLLIEVADASLLADRLVKIPRYARAGIPEVWLVDLDNGHIERHSGPTAGGYAAVEVLAGGQTLASTIIPAVVLRAEELLA